MRIIPAGHLKPGMILGRDMLGENGVLLLAKGHVLGEREIERIRDINCTGAYVADEENDDVIPPESVSHMLRSNATTAVKGLFQQVQKEGAGAFSFLSLSKVKNIVEEMVEEITLNSYAVTNMVDLKVFDDYTYYHCVNVAVISIALGIAMGLDQRELIQLGMGAMMHDIGKMFVPKNILDKDGKLTKEEFEQIKIHSQKGYELLMNESVIPIASAMVALTHHEEFKGGGYPSGISKHRIPKIGRITAVADVYDALTSDRPYRRALKASEAVEYIMSCSGTSFDPGVVEAFLKKVSPYPVGTHVILSNGVKGVVVENTKGMGLRPRVRALEGEGQYTVYDLGNDIRLLNVTVSDISYQ